MASNNRVRPPKESRPGKDVHHSGGHFDQGFYTDGPFGPALGGVSGSFPVEDQFKVRRSASQPTPGPTPKPGLFYWDPKGGSK
jgi:hypothetical protein